MLRKAKLRYLIQGEIEYNKHKDMTPVHEIVNSKNSKLIRLMWFTVVTVCFAICSYQTYERMAHYKSGPFTVDVEDTQMNRIKFPALQLWSLDTQKLIPYWKMINESRYCKDTMKGFIEDEIKVDNYNQLWLDSNFTTNLDFIKVTRNTQVLHKTELHDGKIVKEQGFPIEMSYKNIRDGLSLVVNADVKMVEGLQFQMQFHKNGNCNYPSVVISMFDETTTHPNTSIYNNKEVQIDIFLEKYHFLSSKPPYCESDKKVVIKCNEDCKVKDRLPPCRLPYMSPNINVRDCGEEANKTIVKEIYLEETNATNCNCKRHCDKSYYHLRRTEKGELNNDIIIVNIIAFGNSFYTMRERYIYNFIDLLIDLSGNLGFSLNLSLLSLIHICHKLFTYLHKTLTQKLSRETVLIKHALDVMKKENQQQHCCHSFLKLSITLMGGVFSLYVIVMRIEYYNSEPTQFTITLEEMKSYPFLPNIIICGEGLGIFEEKNRFATQNNISNVCTIDTLDLLDEGKMSATQLWELTKPTVDEYTMDNTAKYINFKSNVSWSYIALHSAMCLQVEIDVKQKFPKFLLAALAVEGVDNSCKDNLWEVYWREPGETIHSSMKTRENAIEDGLSIINFKMMKKLLLNLRKQPCVSIENSEKCAKECYKKMMKKEMSCSLPFSQVEGKRECTKSFEAKKNLRQFLNISLHTDIKKECNCYPPCDDITFQGKLAHSTALPVFTKVDVEITDNLIREFRQTLIYNEVALFCDVGNIFGLMIGFSLLSIPYSLLGILA